MTSSRSRWNDPLISDALLSCGVRHYAFARAGEVEPQQREAFDRWIAAGRHAGMAYMERYGTVRNDLRELLPGARSIICCAFPYWHPDSLRAPHIASYALATDYHEVVRERLSRAAVMISRRYPGEWRVCVDTAPLRERYWAQRSGLGIIGRNGHLIIPGAGSYFFLGEILTTAELPCTEPPAARSCGDCGRCVKACPAGALDGSGEVDARRCLSYLTIEHRGDFPEGTDLHGCLYGCDTCGRVCPHNASPEITDIPEFQPRQTVTSLTVERAAELSRQEYSTIFTHSAVKRAKLAGLRRNALTLLGQGKR